MSRLPCSQSATPHLGAGLNLQPGRVSKGAERSSSQLASHILSLYEEANITASKPCGNLVCHTPKTQQRPIDCFTQTVVLLVGLEQTPVKSLRANHYEIDEVAGCVELQHFSVLGHWKLNTFPMHCSSLIANLLNCSSETCCKGY